MKRSIEVLQDAQAIQKSKGEDYQNSISTVEQSDYYLNGVSTIYDTMHGKMLRIRSVMETIRADSGAKPNHESLRDSCIDLINYATFFVAYMEGQIPGQKTGYNMFNEKDAVHEDIGLAKRILVLQNNE